VPSLCAIAIQNTFTAQFAKARRAQFDTVRRIGLFLPAMATPGTTYSTDPALYVFTSLTAGSSHIVTATSRLETILRANKVPFKAVDIAVDEKARMLWGRRAAKDSSGRMRKLPGLVQEGMVLGVSL
jgi:hypothetical protein